MKLGETITHYRIDEPLGQGGMGVVYLATDMSLHRRVAIKFSTAETASETVDPLAAEARAASRLAHPNIASIYELDQTADGRQFFVMEYVPGRNLAQWLNGQPLELRRTLDILRAVCAALAHAHEHGVVHRDIKPANIQITDDGQLKVLDFGLAGRVHAAPHTPTDATLTVTHAMIEGRIAGTPGYMSPEQAAGLPTDYASDLFSLGCVLYECLTGQRPFPATSIAAYFAELHGQAPAAPSTLNSAVPKYLDEITLRLLAKRPTERYRFAGEVLTALDRGDARPSSPENRWWILLVRRKRLAAACALLVAIGGGGLFFWRSRTYTPKPQALHWYHQGLQAVRDGTYLTASKALTESVRLDPDFAPARAHLAEAWLEMDYSDRAREEMIRARRSLSSSRLARFDRLHVEAIDYLVTGDVKETIVRYQEMLGLVEGPDRASVYVDLGRAYERASDPKHAIDSFQQAIQRDPQGAAAYLRLGLLWRRGRDYPHAESAFASAERLYQAASNIEGVTQVKYGRGMLEIDREHLDTAKNILEQALQDARFTGNTQQQVLILLQLATISTHSAALDQVHALATQAEELARADGVENLVSRALITLGGALFLKDKAEAEKYYTTALQIARRNRASLTEARALLALGSLHGSIGQPERAVADLQPAAAYFKQAGYPSDAFRASILLGRTQRDLGDYDGAERVFRELLPAVEKSGSNEEQALLHDAIGQVLFSKENYRGALREYEASYGFYSAAKAATGGAYLLLNRAGALWRLGDYAEATSLLAQAEATALQSGNADLTTLVRMERLLIALSQNRFPEARTLAATISASRTPLTPIDQVYVSVRESLALAYTSGAAAGLNTCRSAVTRADAIRVKVLKTSTLLDCSQVALLAGDRPLALAWAGQAKMLAESAGQSESVWRASTVMARAGANPSVIEAESALTRIKQQWGEADYSRYLTRPDVRTLQSQMLRMGSKT